MSNPNKKMTTRSDSNKKAKWTRSINKKDKDYESYQSLLRDCLFPKIPEEMDKTTPSWDESMNEYHHWSNEGQQLDLSQCLQFQGPYSGHTLSLSLCKKSVLQERTGKEESITIKQP